MTFADPGNLATNDVFPESWADQVRDNFIAMSTWSTWTPTLTQSGTVTKTVNVANYLQIGDLIIVQMKLSVTGTGTAGNTVTVSMPVTTAASGYVVGAGHVKIAGVRYNAAVQTQTTTTFSFLRSDTNPSSAIGTDPNVAFASGDEVHINAIYQSV